MIAHLKGIIGKEAVPGEATVDVHGVGYGLLMPVNDWDSLQDGAQAQVFVTTYVREDRLALYGFVDKTTRSLFEALIELSGIGPRMGLELCGVPRSVLAGAIQSKDPALLMSIKGIGKKSAEKLLLELASLAEREPYIFAGSGEGVLSARFDQDTVDALSQLGFAVQDILKVLEALPPELTSTEERVTAALRSL